MKQRKTSIFTTDSRLSYGTLDLVVGRSEGSERPFFFKYLHHLFRSFYGNPAHARFVALPHQEPVRLCPRTTSFRVSPPQLHASLYCSRKARTPYLRGIRFPFRQVKNSHIYNHSQCFNPHKFYQSQCLLIRLCSLLLVLCSLFIRKPKPVLLHRLHYRFARAQPLPRDRRSLRPFRLIPVKQACFSPQSAYIRFVRCTSFGCGLTPGYTLFLCVSTHFSISYCLAYNPRQ